MKPLVTSLILAAGLSWMPPLWGQTPLPSPAGDVLEVTQSVESNLGWDDRLFGPSGDKRALLRAIDYSLQYLQTPKAIEDYTKLNHPDITRDRVRRSLIRFRQLLVASRSEAELQRAVKREFTWYQSVGNDGQGTVGFTGYFEPTYAGSLTRTAEYRYPLYARPSDFEDWSKPHPTRGQLEGENGLGWQSPLRGTEIVWLGDRLEAFLVHVQGSAQIQLPNGQVMTVGYAGKTDHPYTSIGKELVNAGIFSLESLTLPKLIDYFHQFPEQMNEYLPRNQSFIFFKETQGQAATGNLSVPVTAWRSIATDKSIMPPGALALIHAPLPEPNALGQLEPTLVSRFVLDQDTGSAIKGAGRVDVFMGTGREAGDRAGLTNSNGELYYLLLKR
ncbi:MltA domain-containing protein [Roseofilum reptotaenium CS-1145]|uniref:peptidoglycan lytic exotransglycosylase n=1 Tax=Roseofilum reptotaenium AO1-A TaxID=1925591 RepID=A0A1L9QR16_9CYAN|nr:MULTISPECIES: MltA domain-containing protein [Roseofilum]MBP0028844.1 MltA domain-containing protein [Roseofilum sp. Guam]MDB9516986.1 MltA domain-containing protein [Roseofilum reptotaenium CS-1145]OJJ25121.1 murein transglycosylase [Roseofilum reptotaenium AO1-A]